MSITLALVLQRCCSCRIFVGMELTAFENSFFVILLYLSLIRGSLPLSLLIGLVGRSGWLMSQEGFKGDIQPQRAVVRFMTWSQAVQPPAMGCMPGVTKIASIGTLFVFLILVSWQLVFPYKERIASHIPSHRIILQMAPSLTSSLASIATMMCYPKRSHWSNSSSCVSKS